VSGNSFSLAVQGSGFVSTSQLLSAGVDVATIFISSTQLQGSISISPGTTNIKVGVLNPNAAQSVPASMTLPIQTGIPTSPLQPPQMRSSGDHSASPNHFYTHNSCSANSHYHQRAA
jgi:hypothetical protein